LFHKNTEFLLKNFPNFCQTRGTVIKGIQFSFRKPGFESRWRRHKGHPAKTDPMHSL